MMIIGIFEDVASAETALNNLAEAEFDLSTVSVFMLDLGIRAQVAPDVGPLAGVSLMGLADRLAQLGLRRKKARHLHDVVTQGKVLIVMESPIEGFLAAKEIIQGLAIETLEGEAHHDSSTPT